MPIYCDHEGCEAPAGGGCALGHPSPADCPEAAAAAARVSATADTAASEDSVNADELMPPPPPDGVEVGAGIALTVEEGNALASRHGARLVLPAGPIDAGKTTFIVELYARFMKGKQEGSSFYESQTLLDFELLSFPSRLLDENELPQSWRTRIEDSVRPLLHLGVMSRQGDPVHLLLGNFSGEFFERICDHGEALQEVPLLAHCDRLLIFVDGEEMRSGGTRSTVVSQTRQLIRVLREEEALGRHCKVALVLAKLDRLEAAGEEEMEAWTGHETRLLSELEELGKPTKVFRIAMRPQQGLGADEDSAALFEWLLESDPSPVPPVPATDPPQRTFEGYGNSR